MACFSAYSQRRKSESPADFGALRGLVLQSVDIFAHVIHIHGPNNFGRNGCRRRSVGYRRIASAPLSFQGR